MNQRTQNRYNNHRAGSSNHGNRQNTPPAQQFRSNQSKPSPTTPPAIRSGLCVLCKAVTVLVCQRCGDFYCSPACQQRDWSKHRYICFEMPSLIHSSAKLTLGMPALNGYQNRELPQSVLSEHPISQNRKWIGGSPSSPIQEHQQPQQQQKRQTPPKSIPKESGKPLEKIDSTKAAINIGKVEQVAFPKNNTNVLLTAFRSSNRIFLRSIEKEENDGYCDVIKAINTFGKTAGPLKSLPSRNAFAITDFKNDGLYYRVQVVSVKSETEIQVIYYDFGNEATKKLSELKEISKECAELKQYIVAATLRNVPFVKDFQLLEKYLKTFEDVEAKIVYNEQEKPKCEIMIWGVEESLNSKIILYLHEKQLSLSKVVGQPKKLQPKQEKNIEKPPAPAPPQQQMSVVKPPIAETLPQIIKSRPSHLAKPVMVPPFEIIYFPVGAKNLKVVVMDNSFIGYIGCMLVEDRNNLRDIQVYLSAYEDKGQAYKPKIEEYCLAKYQDSWYRAKAVDILPADIVEVVFIDFLNESQVKVCDVRRYPMDLDYPCKTSLCMIEEIPDELDVNLTQLLTEKLQPGSEHIINEITGVEEEDSNVVIVKMNQVVEWLSTEHSV